MPCGSSPLARGTQGVINLVELEARLIPARAGNTMMRSETPLSNSAHPRSRGEHIAFLMGSTKSVGSSPLARGTLLMVSVDYGVGRLIPARAGNTITVDTSVFDI